MQRSETLRSFLLFQLWGPLASWGTIAVGEERASDVAPTRSAVLGLLAASLGIPRNDEDRQRDLAAGYAMGVRVDRQGVLLRDFHTIQVPLQTASRKARVDVWSHELASQQHRSARTRKTTNTIVSYREYRADGGWTVGLAAREGAPYSLQELRAALSRPFFVPYLGRKSCPLGLPMGPRLVRAPDMIRAFAETPPLDLPAVACPQSAREPISTSQTVYVDEDLAKPSAIRAVRERWDQPLSRCRWQFEPRREIVLQVVTEDQ